MKKSIFILLLVFFIISCNKNSTTYNVNSEYGAYEFEKYISKLIANKDTLEFTSNFIFDLDLKSLDTLSKMAVIYERSPSDIVSSIKSRGALFQRLFSDSDEALCNYLPKDSSFYDVSVTYRVFNGVYIAQIEYPSFNSISKNSMEIVAMFLNGKWNIITINFLNI